MPHATITASGGGIENWKELVESIPSQEGIIAAAPFVDAQGMLTNGDQVRGALIYGIDPQYEKEISIITDHMKQGDLDNLKTR